MSVNLYAATTYRIEHGAARKTSDYQGAINGIIDDIVSQNGGGNVCLDSDYPEYTNELEIGEEQFTQMLDTVKEFTEEDFQDLYNQHQENAGVPMSKQEFIDLMTTLYQEADKHDGCIHLSWF